MPRVLVACEYSGRVRDAFIRRGVEAVSCDLEPTDSEGPHYQGDIADLLNEDWDALIAFPPCTHLASSGAAWFEQKRKDGRQQAAIEFVRSLWEASVNHICIENPVGVLSSHIRKPDQIVQPWWFGHGETKATCLWLKNLPELEATNVVGGRYPKMWRMPPSKERSKLRSITYQGIADAMAEQWTNVIIGKKAS